MTVQGRRGQLVTSNTVNLVKTAVAVEDDGMWRYKQTGGCKTKFITVVGLASME